MYTLYMLVNSSGVTETLFLFCKVKAHLCCLYSYKWYHTVFAFLCLTSLLSMIISGSIHIAENDTICSFNGWSILYMYIYLLYPFICQWTFRLFLCLGYLTIVLLWKLGYVCLFKLEFYPGNISFQVMLYDKA